MKTYVNVIGGRPSRSRGFTLIELMITIAVIALLAAIALPSYQNYIVRSNRNAMMGELSRLATLQEKIFLNSNAYASNVSAAYTGVSSGGLGLVENTLNSRYTVTLTATANTFTLVATPLTNSAQNGDGSISITSEGRRLWGTKPW